MNIGQIFPELEKYKVVCESISGDGFSNVMRIERIYRLPWYEKRVSAILKLHKYDRKEFKMDGVTVHSIAGGWADPLCHTMRQIIQVVPNDGHIIYNDNE